MIVNGILWAAHYEVPRAVHACAIAAANMDRTEIQGVVLDADGGRPLPARVHVESVDGVRHVVESIGGEAVHYRREPLIGRQS